jgi:hypothetical protein
LDTISKIALSVAAIGVYLVAYQLTATTPPSRIEAHATVDLDASPRLSSRASSTPRTVPVERPRFRYSLIAGGVTSVAELRASTSLDPILKKAYGEFNWARAHAFVFGTDTGVFMEFRRGNIIHWTKNRVVVPAGTLAFTDGRFTVLARCGNLISWAPSEPSEEINPGLLESPVEPISPPATPPTVDRREWQSASTTTPALPGPVATNTTPSATTGPQVETLGGTPCCFGVIYLPPVNTTSAPPSVTPPITPTVQVPEPSSLTLLVAGLLALAIIRKAVA